MSDTDAIRHRGGTPQAPTDPNVHVPESVKRAAALAESYYSKAPAAAPAAPPAAESTILAPDAPPAPPPAPVPPADVTPPAPPADVAPPAPPADVTPPADADIPPAQWEHRYRSMKGRHDAQVQINGQMQEQMALLGDELVRTQNMMMASPQRQPQAPAPKQTLITPEDTQNYGQDLIDLTRRAALDAVTPQLTALEQENQRLTQRLTKQSQMGVVQTLDQQIPNWREINNDIRFKRWLSLPDIYSGVVRKQTLDAAYQAASAPRVLAFFKGFIADEAIVAGNATPDPTQIEQPTPPAPRVAAVPLERLAAPGRARPAGGNDAPNVPADKPVFTRHQITAFYDDVRRGVYAGREPEKAAFERSIFAAQNDGRIR